MATSIAICPIVSAYGGAWQIMSCYQKIRTEQNKCVKLLNRTDSLNTIYKIYTILKLDDVIDLELK